MKLEILLAKDASNVQGWIVEGGDDEDEELEPDSGLTGKIIGEASGADEILQSRKNAGNV